MTQDFDHRISIVVNNELPTWQVLNAVAHISAYFGNQLESKFGTGEYFTTQDNVVYPRNSQYAIIILGARPDELSAFATKARTGTIQCMSFIREMIETTDDTEIIEALAQKPADQVEVLGIGFFGENQAVKGLTRQFRLWK
jgi:hypothetical protein